MKPDPMTARDLVGYGEFPPHPDWPGQAVIAVNFNLNVEGGGEATLANGDDVWLVVGDFDAGVLGAAVRECPYEYWRAVPPMLLLSSGCDT